MKKRILSFVLALAICMSLLPTAVFADGPLLIVDGTNYTDLSGDITGDGWKWIADMAYLVLNGYDGGPISYTGELVLFLAPDTVNTITAPDDFGGAAVETEGNLNLVGFGDLNIAAPNADGVGLFSQQNVWFDSFDGNLVIRTGGIGIVARDEFSVHSGSGSVTIEAGAFGISAGTSVTLANFGATDLTITSGGDGVICGGSICLSAQSSADIRITAAGNGVMTTGFADIILAEYGNGTVTIEAGEDGIRSTGGVIYELSDEDISVTAGGKGIVCAEEFRVSQNGGDLTVNAASDGITAGNVYFHDCSGIFDITSANGRGLYTENEIYITRFFGDVIIDAFADGINAGSINICEDSAADIRIDAGGVGIFADSDVTLKSMRPLTITAGAEGIWSDGGKITLRPQGGDVSITAGTDGIVSGQDMSVVPCNADLTVQADGDGIAVGGSLSLSPEGGDVTVNAGGRGVFCAGAETNVESRGGSVTITAGGDGIYAAAGEPFFATYGGCVTITAQGYGVWGSGRIDFCNKNDDAVTIIAVKDAVYSDTGDIAVDKATDLIAESADGNAIALGTSDKLLNLDGFRSVSLTAENGRAVYNYADGNSPVCDNVFTCVGAPESTEALFPRVVFDLNVDGTWIVNPKVDAAGTGWSWDAATRTLTLDGYDGSYISAQGGLNLVVKSDSVVTAPDGNAIRTTYGDLRISGAGDLDLRSEGGGYGLYVDCGDLELDLEGDLSVSTNDWNAIHITNGAIRGVVGGNLTGSMPKGGYFLRAHNGIDLTVGGDMVCPEFTSQYAISNGLYGDLRLNVAGDLKLTAEASVSLISVSGCVDITVGGNAEIINKATGATGAPAITQKFGDQGVRLSVGGELRMAADLYGIYTGNGPIVFEQGTFDLQTGGNGIFAAGNTSVVVASGADVTMRSSDRAIDTYGCLSINVEDGCSLDVGSADDCVYCEYGHLNVKNDGEISLASDDSGSGIKAVYGEAVIDNSGILLVDTNGAGIENSCGGIRIANTGELDLKSEQNYGLYTGNGGRIGIENSGTVRVDAYEDAIRENESGGIVIDNCGELELTSLYGPGIYAQDSGDICVTNFDTMKINAPGCGMEARGTGVDIRNHGSLTVISTDADDIYTQSSLNIRNYGTLTFEAENWGWAATADGPVDIGGNGTCSFTGEYGILSWYGNVTLDGSGPVTVTANELPILLTDPMNVGSMLVLEGIGSPITLTATSGSAVIRDFDGASPVGGSRLGDYTVEGAPEESKVVYTRAPEGYTTCPGDASCPLKSKFTDVDPTRWYHDGIHYCFDRGLMIGTSATTFNPTGKATRAEFTAVLWRLAGEPVVADAMNFVDVPEGKWYTEAIRWATAEKLVFGYNETHFGPTDVITREQAVTLLYRYAKYKGEADLGSWSFPLDFVDSDQISTWANEAAQWCALMGIVTGKTGKVFDPKAVASRAEVACMVQRFCECIAE